MEKINTMEEMLKLSAKKSEKNRKEFEMWDKVYPSLIKMGGKPTWDEKVFEETQKLRIERHIAWMKNDKI